MNKLEKKRVNNVNTTNWGMDECDILYKRYSQLKQGRHDFDLIHSAYESYQSARIKLNMRTFHKHQKRYQEMLSYPDDRKLWDEIDWSGKYKSEKNTLIPISCMVDYFETLYEPVEILEINKFETNIYIPITDDPIDEREVKEAASKMKKGGYDLSLNVLKLLMSTLLPFLVIFMNMLFYITYPMKLALSLPYALPKMGDLSLMKKGLHSNATLRPRKINL